MNRLVYLVMAFLNPFEKLCVMIAPQQGAVEAPGPCPGFFLLLLLLPAPPANAHVWK